MKEYTYDDNIFSDLYKDVNGFRPRGHEYYDSDPDAKQAIWDALLLDLDEVNREYEREQKRAEAKFAKAVMTAVKSGAGNLDTAFRWLISNQKPYWAEGYCMMDIDSLLHDFGLSRYGFFGFRMFKRFERVIKEM